ncbi:MAG TPA: hypothetical protein VGB68_16030 [Pyrinomonadaceae bacterium]|jgi:hypothetical protein
MQKRFLILILLCLPLMALGQNSEYQGNYRALSLNFLTDDKFEAKFEVAADGNILGKFFTGEQKIPVENDLIGKVDAKGKFEAQATRADGTIFSIKGELPKSAGRVPIQFKKKLVVASKGKKQVGELETMGLLERLPSPPTVEAIFPDSGKTRLKIEYANSIFDGVWENMPVKSIDETKPTGKTYRTLELKTENGDALRSLRFVLPLAENKTEWIVESGKGWSVFYRENKGENKNLFFVTEAGSIHLAGEDERETVWQVKNLVMTNVRRTEKVKISGYIHVAK